MIDTDYYSEFQTLLNKNQATFGKHRGKRIFILGTGPSINKENLSLLKDEVVIATNAFSQCPQFEEIAPQYYVTADPAFYIQDAEGGMFSTFLKIIERIRNIPKDVKLFLPVSYAHHLKDFSGLENLDINWFLYAQKFESLNNINFSQPLPNLGQSILNIALLLALHLQASEIYLVGIDHGGVVKTFDEITDHFYGKHTASDERARKYLSLSGLERSMFTHLNQLQILKRYFETNKLPVFTTSKDGSFKMFPYVRYSSLFRDRFSNVVRDTAFLKKNKLNKRFEELEALERIKEFPKNYFHILGEFYEMFGEKQKAAQAYEKEENLYGKEY